MFVASVLEVVFVVHVWGRGPGVPASAGGWALVFVVRVLEVVFVVRVLEVVFVVRVLEVVFIVRVLEMVFVVRFLLRGWWRGWKYGEFSLVQFPYYIYQL